MYTREAFRNLPSFPTLDGFAGATLDTPLTGHCDGTFRNHARTSHFITPIPNDLMNLTSRLSTLLFLLMAVSLQAQNSLQVIYPNGGEQLATGSATTLRWLGGDPGTPVTLEYSTDNGAVW